MGGSNLLHYAAMRIRVVGTGDLQLAFLGFDSLITQSLPALTLTATASYKRDRLSNFIGQGVRWQMGQTGGTLTEFARVNDVTIFVKQQWSQIPG